MHITSGVHHKESCVKVAEYISHQECNIRKIVLKVRNTFMTMYLTMYTVIDHSPFGIFRIIAEGKIGYQHIEGAPLAAASFHI